ncbi:MAG: hypothetical protein JNJ58_13340 [Chitinophagaceae bacterium]|nr:hypothetical protein [Chitinophagaceae bacterium]
MNLTTKSNLYFYLSLVTAIWFLLTSYVWTYLANLFISFPVGLMSLGLWYLGRKTGVKSDRFKWPVGIVIAGVITSLISLVLFLIFD